MSDAHSEKSGKESSVMAEKPLEDEKPESDKKSSFAESDKKSSFAESDKRSSLPESIKRSSAPESDKRSSLAESDKKSSVLESAKKFSSGEESGVAPVKTTSGTEACIIGGGVGNDGLPGVEVEGPPEVQRRIRALKNIQLDISRTESDFFREMHALEMKYSQKYNTFFEKRRDIILGKYEPTDEECKFGDEPVKENGASGGNQEESKLTESLNKLKIGDSPVSGIPDFWLTAFQNVEILADMIEEHDQPVLKHLTDIKVEMTTKPMGFKLLFHFSPNEYFTNPVLAKEYEMKCEIDSDAPFSFEGPEIVKCKGCEINWKEGKNVTIRSVRKKQKHKQTGSVRMVEKTQEIPSFFSFFKPPKVEEGVDLDEETGIQLTSHFEVGQYIRERIIPRAVLYYTGEALDDDEDEEDSEEYDDEEETETEGDHSQSTNGDNEEEDDAQVEC